MCYAITHSGTSGWLNYKLTLMVKSAKKYPKANEVFPARRSDGHGPWTIERSPGRLVPVLAGGCHPTQAFNRVPQASPWGSTGRLAQLDRALASGAKGRGFDSRIAHHLIS